MHKAQNKQMQRMLRFADKNLRTLRAKRKNPIDNSETNRQSNKHTA
jgi:hypothetical protein